MVPCSVRPMPVPHVDVRRESVYLCNKVGSNCICLCECAYAYAHTFLTHHSSSHESIAHFCLKVKIFCKWIEITPCNSTYLKAAYIQQLNATEWNVLFSILEVKIEVSADGTRLSIYVQINIRTIIAPDIQHWYIILIAKMNVTLEKYYFCLFFHHPEITFHIQLNFQLQIKGIPTLANDVQEMKICTVFTYLIQVYHHIAF